MRAVDLMSVSGVAGSWVDALGWMLVHFLWQGCAIALLYWLVCVLSRPGSSHLRYWTGLGSLALCVVVLVSTFATYHEPDAIFLPAGAAPEPVNAFLVLSGSRPDIWSLAQEGIEPALPLVVALWLAGALLMAARTAADWLHVRGLVRRGIGEVPSRVSASAQRIAGQLRLRGAVRILRSTRVAVPMAVGLLRPVILLPASVLVRLPHDQLEMVLAHELGHVRRYDHFFNWLQIALETLLYYHPAIRWISRRVREERENCCDDLVVARCRRPATYARALANLELLRGPVPVAGVMAATGGSLLFRIGRIIDAELPRSTLGRAQLMVMSLLALGVAFGAHQGVALSRALVQVASVAQLQPSDIEWKTWGRSRAAWGEGLAEFAASADSRRRDAPGKTMTPAIDARPAATAPSPPRVARPVTAAPATVTHAAAIEPLQVVAPVAAAVLESGGLGPVVADYRIEGHPPEAVSAVDPTVTRHEASRVPEVLETVQPHYPRRARVRSVEGFVELAFSVNEEGRTYDIEVVESAPSGMFERVSRRALLQWKFAPLPEAGLAPRMTQVFSFDLEDAPAPNSRRTCLMTGSRTCRQPASPTVVVYVNPPREQFEEPDRNQLN